MSGIIAVGHKHIMSVFNIQKTHHIPANPEHPALFWAAVILQTHLKVQSKFPKLLWSHTWLWSVCSYPFTNPIHSLLPDLLRQHFLAPVIISLWLYPPSTSMMDDIAQPFFFWGRWVWGDKETFKSLFPGVWKATETAVYI